MAIRDIPFLVLIFGWAIVAYILSCKATKNRGERNILFFLLYMIGMAFILIITGQI